jgi:hypothetical protein
VVNVAIEAFGVGIIPRLSSSDSSMVLISGCVLNQSDHHEGGPLLLSAAHVPILGVFRE